LSIISDTRTIKSKPTAASRLKKTIFSFIREGGQFPMSKIWYFKYFSMKFESLKNNF